MRVLAVDTCLAACQAAVIEGGHVLAVATEAMTRGHQERLAPMVREVMFAARVRFEALDRIAVTVGPGSFTGLRVGLAFAKGLAFALNRPSVGVGTLAALAASDDTAGHRAAAIDAGRGAVFLQLFDGEEPSSDPVSLPLESALARLAEWAGVLIGPQASALARGLGVVRPIDLAAPSPAAIAGLGERAHTLPPHPLYLRAPDAKVSAKSVAG
jgi:tRNA threonylcarbamoyladenosine biosynthesis protein TsaB